MMQLITHGVPTRYPKIKIINSHLGRAEGIDGALRSVVVRVAENGGLTTLGSAGSGIGVQPPGEVPPPPSTSNAPPDCTARSARKATPTAPRVLNRESPPDLSSARRVMISLPFLQPGPEPKVSRSEPPRRPSVVVRTAAASIALPVKNLPTDGAMVWRSSLRDPGTPREQRAEQSVQAAISELMPSLDTRNPSIPELRRGIERILEKSRLSHPGIPAITHTPLRPIPTA